MKQILLTLTFTFIVLLGYSQDYFQQEVNYKIEVNLNDTLHELFANESIEYTNNSSDTLYFLWFHMLLLYLKLHLFDLRLFL